MNVDFVRFKASDGVELEGWLSDAGGETAVIHVHGMSGSGYKNHFLDNLRAMYLKKGISFLSFDNRGLGIINRFRRGSGFKNAGSCYEIFSESFNDIQGAIDYLKSLGKTKFILEGHSLGSTKVINYVLNQKGQGLEKVVLLAPTDMPAWADTDPRHQEFLTKAKKLLAENRGEELVDAQCWKDKTPISAQTYPTICEAGSPADVYGEREGGPLLGRIDLPMIILYGDKDIGITRVNGTADEYVANVNKIKNANTSVEIIKGSDHGYNNHEQELANLVEKFLG